MKVACKVLALFLRAAGLIGLVSAAQASNHDYYKGKTLRFIVAFSAGGTFDAYTRVIARHFGKHVPGNPSVVVENMTGAGGIIQANCMFQRAKPDGHRQQPGKFCHAADSRGPRDRVRQQEIRIPRRAHRVPSGVRVDQG